MVTVNQGTVLALSTFVRFADTREGAVLIDIRNDQCKDMNQVAAFICKHIQAGRPLGQIALALAQECSIAVEEAWTGVQDCVQQLHDHGLLSSSPTKGTTFVRRTAWWFRLLTRFKN